MNILRTPLTIDALRELGDRESVIPHYMGLGVVKLPVSPRYAYHFYSDQAEIFCDPIHEHRFNFTSTVVRGRFKNTLYTLFDDDPNSPYVVEEGECGPDTEKNITMRNVRIHESASFVTSEGESYSLAYDTWHRVECLTNKVITFLDKQPFVHYMGRILQDSRNPLPCSFSRPKTVKNCWEIIEYTIT
jgi:hypothetical protein